MPLASTDCGDLLSTGLMCSIFRTQLSSGSARRSLEIFDNFSVGTEGQLALPDNYFRTGTIAAAAIEPSALCAVLWQTRVQAFVARLYEIGTPLFWPTTAMSKLISLCPEMPAVTEPNPCAVWQTEQLKPSVEMCRLCGVQLALERMLVRSWHFAHSAYGPSGLRSGVGYVLLTVPPGIVAWLNW